ncbi:family 1 glycosylhydrolase [Azospirillum sp.]|uniref:family 1 glycosylhydrolase n=1 Tax=Azospirillum sp. TaxID=34012 RepID=UPI002D33D36A|nr:family 1 glycosylhydrolase [Azospirillum sp.]HYF89211.1 family 1 glycosylhydrolase [Azospirillum sp.]
MPELEIWGGLECTVARIRNTYVDQTLLNGHERRPDDLDRFASLGIKRIRYPVLWERVAPNGIERADWSWTDERLERLRELGVLPIAGLTHHGSGPRHTSMLEASFATGLAEFAARVAERYPWIDAYTPVNEPLTTARFSGLYGFWYPHTTDEASFLRMLVNETRATQRSMRAIRTVNPSAMLIQTEDITRIHGTPPLVDAVAFQNQRRWLSLDLLTGRVDEDHPFWSRFRDAGLADAITAFVEEPCIPDILGFNHYLTSERFIDHRVTRYPSVPRSRDGSDGHADVEAVSVLAEGPAGIEALLREAWERYRLPLAITEAHNGSTRDEQLRWLNDFWQAALNLKADGVDVRAVTVWSLLGSYDWNRLLTKRVGYYESGPFDVRSPQPRETALAAMTRQLAATGTADHPVLDSPGLWHRADRFRWAPVRICPYTPADRRRPATAEPRMLLIVGATGTLGRAFARACTRRGLAYRLVGRTDLDIADRASVDAALALHRPWAVINAAGFVRVDDAERMEDQCRRENAVGPAILAAACAALDVPLVGFSSDLVFGGNKEGTKETPYVETDPVAPLNVYGRTKAEAEQAMLTHRRGLVIRTSAFFGPWDEHNFIATTLRALADGTPVRAAADVTVSPTYVPDLVNTTLDLLIDDENGIWHLVNAGAVTWAEFARDAARRAKLDPSLVEGIAAAEMGWTAARPRFSALASTRGSIMPTLDNALAACLRSWGEESMTGVLPFTQTQRTAKPTARRAPTPTSARDSDRRDAAE